MHLSLLYDYFTVQYLTHFQASFTLSQLSIVLQELLEFLKQSFEAVPFQLTYIFVCYLIVFSISYAFLCFCHLLFSLYLFHIVLIRISY